MICPKIVFFKLYSALTSKSQLFEFHIKIKAKKNDTLSLSCCRVCRHNVNNIITLFSQAIELHSSFKNNRKIKTVFFLYSIN